MSERSARGVLLAVCAALVAAAGAARIPQFWADGATYHAMAWSLAEDGDFRYEARDIYRVRRELPSGPQGIFSAREVTSTKDLENQPWRAYSPATARIGELLKAQSVTVQASELAQALSTGKVVAMMTSSATGVDSKVWEQVNGLRLRFGQKPLRSGS